MGPTGGPAKLSGRISDVKRRDEDDASAKREDKAQVGQERRDGAGAGRTARAGEERLATRAEGPYSRA